MASSIVLFAIRHSPLAIRLSFECSEVRLARSEPRPKWEKTMPEAYIYDHVRTPRGRGKADGALHEVTALALATVPLQALKQRHNLGEDVVDDVILGVVDPVGEGGREIARVAALQAGAG